MDKRRNRNSKYNVDYIRKLDLKLKYLVIYNMEIPLVYHDIMILKNKINEMKNDLIKETDEDVKSAYQIIIDNNQIKLEKLNKDIILLISKQINQK